LSRRNNRQDEESTRRKKPRRKKESKPIKPVKPQVKIFRKLEAKTPNQAVYIKSIHEFPVTFCIGPAGTGKTFLACYVAAQQLAEAKIHKITLVRPAVEAGEKIGFLPGGIDDKLHPFLIPLFDSLSDMIGMQKTKELLKDGIIEVVPLAFMRGRTMNNSFVILDEAQNSTIQQMKMFLTRMGHNTTFVVNGDVTQSDLEEGSSGLADAQRKLTEVNGVNWVELTQEDIVRHPVVQGIVAAYERSF
jgi:phosphate starvation-inducible PhoH-like protein